MQIKQHKVIDASFRLNGEMQAEKHLMEFMWNPWNVLINEDEQKKEEKWHFQYIKDRYDQIATCTKFPKIKYKFYGLRGDFIKTIN